MASGNLEEREKAYLTNAASTLRKPGNESDSVLRLLLLQAFITALQGSPAVKKLDRLGIELDSLKWDLLQIAVPAVKAGAVQGNRQLSMVVALEALGSLDRETVREALSDAVPQLLEDSDVLVKSGVPVGWDMRIFLAYHFPERLASPLRVKLPADATSSGEEYVGTAAAALGKLTLLRYVDTVGSAADEKARFRYLQDLLLEDYDDQEALGRHLVIHRLVHHLKGKLLCVLRASLTGSILTASGCRPSDSTDRFDLAQAHSTLCNRLQRTTNPSLFILTSKTINLLLDQSPACMTQWNIELTLSSIAIICSQSSTETLVSASPRVYESLCRLAEAVIKRHRKRLDGHFHILVTALQALLRLLLSRPPPSDANQLTTTSTATIGSEAAEGARHHHSLWEKHAKLFSRLLTLVCEPTVASVSRSQTSGLDSEKDRAKRYAGQFMYLVLMQYVKLQLEYVVPLGVRDALEAGIYSIMDITTQDGLKVMNDAMDPSGRVIFKELYKQYQKFGKWTGV
jgi:nucleolar pre-ribosomal-associated protein 2